MTLTPKQKAFADYYIQTGNASEAARKAGYSPKTADAIGRENLRKPMVSAYIAERQGKIESNRICSLAEIQEFRSRVIRGEEKDRFGLDIAVSDKLKSANDLEKSLQVLEAEKARREIILRNNRNFRIPGELLGSQYVDANRDISDHKHTEYMIKGGRGSIKSTYISLKIVELIKNNPDMNAVILRKVGATLEKSVYNQVIWALDALGVADDFKIKKSPMEIVAKETGQTIYFSGLDDPLKLKSIKPKMGYIGILWFEELDQFAGEDECRNVRQSTIRGGDKAYIFQSFNPPKTRNNWANEEAERPKENRLVLHTDYRSVPPEWLGTEFLDEAEYIKEINPTAYEHEYLGIPNGNGGMVFENVVAETITDDQIRRFDRVLHGVDWGYYPDPWAYNAVHYDAARRTLYIFDELTEYKKGNKYTGELLLAKNLPPDQPITADSAEPKSVADYRSYGLNCRGAIKGPGSVDYSMKWLQSLVKIVIDPARCPDTYKEFVEYEYERTKGGEIISGYPDRDNHHIDGVRYATEEIWKWMGE